MTKKIYDQKIGELVHWLLSIGAKPGDDYIEVYRLLHLETRAGLLRIIIDNDSKDLRKKDVVFSILCRFDNPGLAAQLLGLKPTHKTISGRQIYADTTSRLSSNSGKWNFHCYGLDELINAFRTELQIFLEPVLV